jgi:hypothetical protein
VNRRTFLKALSAIPVVGALGAFLAPVLRYLKPNLEPGLGVPQGKVPPDLAEGDLPKGEPLPIATLEELREPWVQQVLRVHPEVPAVHPELAKAAAVPGVAIKLPWKLNFPGYKGGKEPTDIVVFSVSARTWAVFSTTCPTGGR